MTSSSPILSSDGISMSFGDFKVLSDISLDVARGEIVGVLGPNGAGKTTYMNLLTGALPPTGGRVFLGGEDVTRLDTAQRCHRGLARTHQVPKPFSGMTVFENVLVAVNHGRMTHHVDPVTEAWQVLEETGLAHVANRPAETLGLLDRKRLELSRALATDPTVLLLDEIGGGLTDAEGDALVALIRDIHARGITIIWIEHIMRLLLEACTRLVCMAEGKVLADGTPHEVVKSPAVQVAYFGAAA
ncbi:ABC transporter ATP-binding protein [Actibacterium lipolyticum]|uniref:Lipopolysaccharide export system ATP-binding protein LptB n=1 Tax=Actibacterium lipolyticum TaxID=1524263 RepID=A0A238KTC5_9RHOB|nr:ABC transporter ATP-binding protein [Actibacterium lipolyticum]SMX45920.1 Lipopolysaccharide export system ATP-binding protein LptB [Actibacterium lipolyticum]